MTERLGEMVGQGIALLLIVAGIVWLVRRARLSRHAARGRLPPVRPGGPFAGAVGGARRGHVVESEVPAVRAGEFLDRRLV